MAVFAVHVYRPNPGRAFDMLGQMARAKAIFESNGAIVTTWQPLVGGDAGTIAFVDAYDGPGSYGRTMDAISKSADWQALFAEITTNPTGVNLENYSLVDIDTTLGLPTVASRVLHQVLHRPTPGRMIDFLAAQATGIGHLNRLGGQARGMRVIGRQSAGIATLIGFEDMLHYGEFGEKIDVDEQWAMFQAGLAADPPGEELESGVAVAVDLP
jgi:hypothetical protein